MPTSEKIVFLFGSGISIPAELPSTEDITQILLRGEGIVRATDGTYYLGDSQSGYNLTDEYVPRVKAFLERIKLEIDAFYPEDSHETNYEDFYYMASQIRDCEDGEYDNPAIKPLIDKIYPDIKPLLDKRENDTHYDWTLLDLAAESANCIRDVVWRCLLRVSKRLDHLQLIKRRICLPIGNSLLPSAQPGLASRSQSSRQSRIRFMSRPHLLEKCNRRGKMY
ncbi:MAG: hypothetical protein HZB19_15360 [Chloroflexi bacterium]|nr:hypothetical protein [Chloroflexota bacterium]